MQDRDRTTIIRPDQADWGALKRVGLGDAQKLSKSVLILSPAVQEAIRNSEFEEAAAYAWIEENISFFETMDIADNGVMLGDRVLGIEHSPETIMELLRASDYMEPQRKDFYQALRDFLSHHNVEFDGIAIETDCDGNIKNIAVKHDD